MNQTEVSKFINIFHFFAEKGYFSYSNSLFKEELEKDWNERDLSYNKMLLVTFLRANSSFKKRINSYEDFLKKSIKYLESNEINPLKVLKGII